jgi:hypothetical protein
LGLLFAFSAIAATGRIAADPTLAADPAVAAVPLVASDTALPPNAALPANPVVAAHPTLAITYGPTRSVHFALNRKNLGVYLQPIIYYSSDDARNRIEYGGRLGIQAGYTAFAYRQFECRLIGGMGWHWASMLYQVIHQDQVLEEFEDRQWAAELWMQPEFRFYERFGMVLQAQIVRYLSEDRDTGPDRQTAQFETPDLSLGELRIGLRYYLPLGR